MPALAVAIMAIVKERALPLNHAHKELWLESTQEICSTLESSESGSEHHRDGLCQGQFDLLSASLLRTLRLCYQP